MKSAYFEMNENENTSHHSICHVTNIALEGNLGKGKHLISKEEMSSASTSRNQEKITLSRIKEII